MYARNMAPERDHATIQIDGAQSGGSRNEGTQDDRLSALILRLCAERGPGKSICPSEVARAAADDPSDRSSWRPLMRPVRAAAAALQDSGQIRVLRKGRPVDIRTVKGVIRLALAE